MSARNNLLSLSGKTICSKGLETGKRRFLACLTRTSGSLPDDPICPAGVLRMSGIRLRGPGVTESNQTRVSAS